MSEKSILGGALAEVAGPLKDFAEKLGGEDGEQWFAAFKRFLRKEDLWPRFPIWKTIELGVDPKTADGLRKMFQAGGIKVSQSADEILGKSRISVKKIKIDLVLPTTAELTGKKEGGTITEVFAGADRLGLEKCPAEVGPRLRLSYLNQADRGWIMVGMEPILVSVGYPGIFGVERGDSELWLDAYWGSPDYVWGPDDRWVFVRPRK